MSVNSPQHSAKIRHEQAYPDELVLDAAVNIAEAKLRLRRACRDLEHHRQRQRLEGFALTFQGTILELNNIGRALENERILQGRSFVHPDTSGER